MDELEQKSNNELLFEVKQLEADYESTKLRMLKDLDKLEEMDKKFVKINNILNKRLKGEI